ASFLFITPPPGRGLALTYLRSWCGREPQRSTAFVSSAHGAASGPARPARRTVGDGFVAPTCLAPAFLATRAQRAQLSLQYLAGGALGQLVDDGDVLGDLVVRDARLEERAQPRGVELGAAPQHDG